jgi:fumarate reductase flavoprotein subunit
MSADTAPDVVVVGAGIAGLSAAVSAQEQGLHVVVLEKQPAAGGSSVMSGGFFAFTGTDEQAAQGVEDSVELFRSDLVALGGGAADERLVDAYLAEQESTYRWMRSLGIEFDEIEISSGQSAARSHHTDIKGVIALLRGRFVADGGTFLADHAVTELVTDGDGTVSGVVATTPDGVRRIAAHAVVLSSGGFSRSTDLLGVFAPDQRNAIPYGGLGNTGDGLRMAWRLGAGMADMGYVSGTYGSHPDTGIEFHELLTGYYMGAIIVNQDGRRFVDESESYKLLGRACLAQPDGLGYQVFDRTVRAKSHPGLPLNDIDMLEDLGHVFRADSIEELAEQCGIDPDTLRATVDRYNADIAAGSADEFGRTALVNGVGDLLPIVDGPFYAYPAKTLMTTTFCGVTVTPDARVRRVDDSVIGGLFATGEVIGGFHGRAYMTGTSLGKGAVFGRIVARALAEDVAAVR